MRQKNETNFPQKYSLKKKKILGKVLASTVQQNKKTKIYNDHWSLTQETKIALTLKTQSV